MFYLLPFWIGIWAVVGAVVTPFVYGGKGRSQFEGFVTGAIVGFLGGIILLLPLWLLIPQSGKKCPNCAETIKREAQICKHCGTEFELPLPEQEVDRIYKRALDAFTKKRYKLVVTLCTEAIAIQPRAAGYLLRGKSYKQLGRINESAEDFRIYKNLSAQKSA